MTRTPAYTPPTSFRFAGIMLGEALSGFFDGILFHQILQWHHLLSLVPGTGGLPQQVVYDGIFHALMYLLAGAGLIVLFRNRGIWAAPGTGRMLVSLLLIGFGAWNVFDVIVDHWILGLHRARVDVADPLPWDIGWLIILGLVPLALGVMLKRIGGGGGGGRTIALATIAAVSVGAYWAAQPPAGARSATVVFAPGMSDGQALNAIAASGGLPLSGGKGVWAVTWQEPDQAGRLYGQGALFVSSSLLGAGCLGWSRDSG